MVNNLNIWFRNDMEIWVPGIEDDK